MTDVFNIDLETEGFRRNNLDWRKFRDKYNKLSASKLERGIKPLPLTLLLKLFGPQKVFNTYVVTRRNTAELDYYTETPNVDYSIGAGMRGYDKDKSVAKPLNFPGEAILINPEEIKEVLRKSTTKSNKHVGLPVRPVFQRSLHVPGRYFPKPTGGEESSNLAVPYVEGTRERPWTYTPHAVSTNATSSSSQHRPSRSSGFKGKSAVLSKNAKVIRGSVCKSTEPTSTYPPRALSGKSTTTVKSTSSTSYYNDQNHLDRKFDAFPGSFHNDGYSNGSGSIRSESYGDLSSDVFNVKRLRLSARQVTFPKSSQDFRTILQGRPKTLHRRELTESVEQREPRARTHVGFAVGELT